MKHISLDNGRTYTNAHDAMPAIMDRRLWDALVALMDDDAREQVSLELAPCAEEDFLRRYLEIAPCDLVIG